jgi:DNA-binding PadR family transcriptional regulator
MAKVPNLGEFELLVLLAAMRLGKDAYGVSIRKEIETRTARVLTHGALYTTLDRLENKGLLRSRVGDPTPERGGRAKRYYQITAAGNKAVARARTAFESMFAAVEGKARA